MPSDASAGTESTGVTSPLSQASSLTATPARQSKKGRTSTASEEAAEQQQDPLVVAGYGPAITLCPEARREAFKAHLNRNLLRITPEDAIDHACRWRIAKADSQPPFSDL